MNMNSVKNAFSSNPLLSIAATAGALLIVYFFFSTLFSLALGGAAIYGGYLAYKHIYKPWKSEKDIKNKMKSNNQFYYDEQDINRKVADAMKASKSRR